MKFTFGSTDTFESICLHETFTLLPSKINRALFQLRKLQGCRICLLSTTMIAKVRTKMSSGGIFVSSLQFDNF